MLTEPDTVEYKYFVVRGLPWRRVIEFFNDDDSAYNLTGHQVACKIRKPPRGVGAVVAADVATIESPPTNGHVTLYLTAEQTQALLRGTYNYDVWLIYANGEGRQMLKGDITVMETDSHA